MNVVKPSPFSTRTKSLRERFASKRSYSENFKDPTVSSDGVPKDCVREVRPSLPIIGLGESASSPHRRQVSVLAEQFNPFAALPEETYCSALDINSHQGDPRFPWQRDAAIQCDLSPTGEGYKYARKDSFYMLSQEASRIQQQHDIKMAEGQTSDNFYMLSQEASRIQQQNEAKMAEGQTSPETSSVTITPAPDATMSIAEKFKEVCTPPPPVFPI